MIKRICFFVGHYDPARQVIFNYYEKIFPDNLEVFLVCASKFDKEKFHLKRTKVVEILDKKFNVPFKLRKFLKENEIDLLINLTGVAEVAVTMFLATVFTRTKNIFYFLGNPRINLKNSFFLFSQFFTNAFLTSGKEIADKLKKFLIFRRNKTFYLPFPINTNLFKPMNKKYLRKKLGFKEKDKILFYVGRIEVEQGSDYLLELIKQNTDKKFILIGEMKDKNYRVQNFKNLIHIPFVSNTSLPEYYNIADMTLFFSKRNAYPYPPREALACGVPVIVFNLNTFGQLITPAAVKVPFDMNQIQKEIDKFFLLSKKQKKELAIEGRNFIINDSSEEKLKKVTLNRLFKV
jgi:glycosyltransferase involved in cell wall biosynthesis